MKEDRTDADSSTISERKKSLRGIMKKRLSELSFDPLQTAAALFENLSSISEVARAKTLGLYVDFRNEAPTRPILPRFFEVGEKTIAIPYCEGGDLRFYRLRRPKVDFKTNLPIFEDLEPSKPFGILEPKLEARSDSSRQIAPETLDALIVPGLAFDRSGRRLGRGAGYYDRYIPLLRPSAIIVGYCLDEQLVERVPTDRYDARVDFVATPSRVLRADKEDG
ncbi:MAG: 5-formyltetrahydrofolate cyclo-ligase [Thermoguttaceae bacterium]|nr:5-formyltetrahydrofolate cyclo-ligase [Thermoguttaceae bacterium]